MDYAGALRLDDQPPLEATLRISNDELTILADNESLGRWSLAECEITPLGSDFRLAIDGDEALFTPRVPSDFQGEIARRWPGSAAAGESPGEQPGEKPGLTSTDLLKWVTAGVGLILLAMVIGGLMARDAPTPGLLTSVPTTAPSVPTVFSGGVDQVTMLWNEAAAELNLGLFLLEQPGPNRLQMNLRPGLVIYATEQPATGVVRSLMIAAAPTLNSEDGDAVLASWGILIATVNPELDGVGRRQLLADLGVAPDRPLTAGLKSETMAGLANYQLRSGVLGGKALLTVVLAPDA